MSRIIGGRFGGRRLRMPAGRDTRPTSDRVREALFNAIASRLDLEDARFADLYAGSGAVGLEAFSRGAGYVLLVERDQKAARVARENVQQLTGRDRVRGAVGAGSGAVGAANGGAPIQPRVELAVERVERMLALPPAAPFDVVFADPPYAVAAPDIAGVLTALVSNDWLAKDALVVIERSTRGPDLEWVPCITADGVRRYGETTLWYGRRS